MKEVWLPVNGFEAWYEVSNLGRVRSLAVVRQHPNGPRRFPSRFLTDKRGKAKYVKTQLFGAPGQFREVRRHVLVAEHFVPNPQGLPFVCHKNDDRSNNSASNLVWGTQSDNAHQAVANGLWEKQREHFRALGSKRRIDHDVR